MGLTGGGDPRRVVEEAVEVGAREGRGRGSLESFDWFYTRVRVRFLRRAMGTHDVR